MFLTRAALPLLIAACGVSPAAAQDAEASGGSFIDDSGRQRVFDAAYRPWFPDRRPARTWRAVGWQAGIIAVGTGWYWLEKDLNSLDWDYPTPWQRINGEAVRFDNNRFSTNTLGHPVAGMAYYGTSRVSGHDPFASLLFAVGSSAVWEWGLEWREQVSINDQIFTPVAGTALGEFVHQLGEYLNSAPGGGGTAQQVAGATLGFPRWLHRQWDDDPPPPELPADALGFSSAYWHRFDVTLETSHLDNETGAEGFVHGLRAEGEIVGIPGFQRPGRFHVAFADGNFSALHLRTGAGEGGATELDLSARTGMAGFYGQSYEGSSSQDLRGHAFRLGWDIAYRHTSRDLLGRLDEVSVVHVLGPGADLWMAQGDLRARVSADVHGDFAAVHSLAYPVWSDDNGSAGVKSVLLEQGYYHAFGLSSRLALEVSLAGFEVGGRVGFGTYSSIEGLDRNQESVTRDTSLADDVLDFEGWAGYAAPDGGVSLRVTGGGWLREGSTEYVTVARADYRWTASAGLRF